MLIGGLVSLVGVYYNLRNQTERLSQDLENEKAQTKELKRRLEEHEDKIEKKLDDISERITQLTVAIKSK
jgi:predicted  nucleic acid-binding Zn-ribbon protein